jgi:pilus assembly protein CpaE
MAQGDKEIRILLVDDIAETRESIKKLLAFESDLKVIGSAGTGREGVAQAKELRPDIIIMDINMPDMDGLEAAGLITKAVPTAGVIMMSVQNDSDYMTKAMLAGARFFLSKPVNMDTLYSTIRNVYDQYEQIRIQMAALEAQQGQIADFTQTAVQTQEGERAGHVLVVYSPQGGAGCTTIATNLASGLMREGVKVLLIDADLQFGDVGMFLNLNAQSTISDIAGEVEELDIDFLDNIVVTHDSGLKSLLGPAKPALADEIRESYPEAVRDIVAKINTMFDFIIIDTSSTLDAVNIPLLDMATKVVLVVNPTLPSVKNVRLILDLFDQLTYPQEKVILTLNRASTERGRKGSAISSERIENWFKRPVEFQIPGGDDSERAILSSITKGAPLIALDRDHKSAATKALVSLADQVYVSLMGADEDDSGEKEVEETGRFKLW